MKKHICFRLLITALALLVLTSIAQSNGLLYTIQVTCTQVWEDTVLVCNEYVDPQYLELDRNKDQVRWSIHASCAYTGCSGRCTVTCPALGIDVAAGANGMTEVRGPFNAPAGRYPYNVVCSPGQTGYIVIVDEDVPTLTEWGLIIFGVVLIGFITWVFLRRRKAVGVGV